MKNEDVVFIKRRKISDSETVEKLSRPNFRRDLSSEDQTHITGNGVLDDRHIMLFQNLLHEKFPMVDGLLATSIGEAGQFPPMQSDFIQILHTGTFHWVCVSNIGCKDKSTVNLYDSLYGGVTQHTKEQVASLLHCTSSDTIQIQVQPVQTQTNGIDCGVFALAFATSLCYGKDPCEVSFSRRVMRQHVWSCIETKSLSMFPHTKRVCSPGLVACVRVPIYCSCQSSSTKGNMVQCDSCERWFHQFCEQICDKFFRGAKSKSWVCLNCKA